MKFCGLGSLFSGLGRGSVSGDPFCPEGVRPEIEPEVNRFQTVVLFDPAPEKAPPPPLTVFRVSRMRTSFVLLSTSILVAATLSPSSNLQTLSRVTFYLPVHSILYRVKHLRMGQRMFPCSFMLRSSRVRVRGFPVQVLLHQLLSHWCNERVVCKQFALLQDDPCILQLLSRAPMAHIRPRVHQASPL